MYWQTTEAIGMFIAEGGYLQHFTVVFIWLVTILVTIWLAYNKGSNNGIATGIELNKALHSDCAFCNPRTKVDNGCVYCDDDPCNCLPF